MRFSTRAKIVVMLLSHRAPSNWNSDKKAYSCLRHKGGERKGDIFDCRKKQSEEVGETKDC